MMDKDESSLDFLSESVQARFIDPNGDGVEHIIEIRTNPITFRSCRITHSRINEKEAGAEMLPDPPPNAQETGKCPFCIPQLYHLTPRLSAKFSKQRLKEGDSILFPNLFSIWELLRCESF